MADLTEREEQRLRYALAIIGEEAARDDPSTMSAVRPLAGQSWWRRRPAIVAGALAAAAALCVVAVVVATGGAEPGTPRVGSALRPPGSSEGGSGSGITYAQGIACAKTIVVGNLLAVRDASQPGRVSVTIDVQEWIKPAQGPNRVHLNVIDPKTYNERRWKPGTHVLFSVPLRHDGIAGVSEGGHVPFDRKMLVQALPKAKHAACPPPFRPDPD